MEDTPAPVRLHVFLARAGLASRRECERLIVAGRVRVNGKVAALGARIDPRKDRVEIDGQLVVGRRPALRYLMLNKPRGCLTTARDPRGRATVLDLVRDVDERVYPVGRLDRDTEGLLLLTNDGELAYRLMHPRFAVPRVYVARVQGHPGPDLPKTLTRGVRLEDGPAAATAATLRFDDHGQPWVELEVREGRHRLVRRMLEAVGHPVVRLRRTGYGPLRLGRLSRGAYRDLKPSELRALRRLVGLEDATSAEGRGRRSYGEASAGGDRHAGRFRGRRRRTVLRARRPGDHPSRPRGT